MEKSNTVYEVYSEAAIGHEPLVLINFDQT